MHKIARTENHNFNGSCWGILRTLKAWGHFPKCNWSTDSTRRATLLDRGAPHHSGRCCLAAPWWPQGSGWNGNWSSLYKHRSSSNGTLLQFLEFSPHSFVFCILVQSNNSQLISQPDLAFSLPQQVLGSEGCLGIITSAIVRVRPLPQVRGAFECNDAGLSENLFSPSQFIIIRIKIV